MTDSTEQREQTLIKKYGSKAALASKRREWQAKSRKSYTGDGGFRYLKKNDPEKLKEISNAAVKKRTKTKSSSAKAKKKKRKRQSQG